MPYKPDAMNFDIVNPRLSRSGLPTERDLEYLRNEMKVKTLINFCTKTNVTNEEKKAKELGFTYIHFPWTAHFYNILRLNYYWRIAESFLILVNDANNHPVHVHCFHGRERTGMMIAIYRMVIDNYSFLDALNEMKKYNFKPFHHPTLVVFLAFFRLFHSNKQYQK